MCIAILNNSNVLSRESLNNCWTSNYHGAGICWSDGQQLHKVVELEKFDTFYQKYLDIRRQTQLPMLLHFRISTGGKVNYTNAHPFLMGEWGLIHNGIISKVPSTSKHSDTWHFAYQVVKPLQQCLLQPALQTLLEEFIGGYNKVVLLHVSGETIILNEKAGHWHDGDWYSNYSYAETEWEYHGHIRVKRGSKPRYDSTSKSTGKSSYGGYSSDWKSASTQAATAKPALIDTAPTAEAGTAPAWAYKKHPSTGTFGWCDTTTGKWVTEFSGTLPTGAELHRQVREFFTSDALLMADELADTVDTLEAPTCCTTCGSTTGLEYDDTISRWWCFDCNDYIEDQSCPF